MKTETVTLPQLTAKLAALKGAQPLSFVAMTDAKVRQKAILPNGQVLLNPHFGRLRKLAKINAFTSFDYEKSVHRQELREGSVPEFEANARQWGQRVGGGGALVEKDGQHYLVAKIQRAGEPVYLVKTDKGLRFVSAPTVRPFLPPDTTAATAAAQGVAKPVIYRNYALRNLASVTVGGVHYRVRH